MCENYSMLDLSIFDENDEICPFMSDCSKAPSAENLIQNENLFLDETSSSSSSSSSDNNEDEITFDPNEWMIFDEYSTKVRPPKLYEFLRLLLNNQRYTSFASWIDENGGLFKIHRPNQVTNLWKQVKGRDCSQLTDYDIFARGIRYYYKSGIMKKTHMKHTYCFAPM